MTSRDSKPGRREDGLHRVVLDDLRQGDFSASIRRDLRDLYRFYLSEEERARLDAMGPVGRFLRMFWWLLRNILLRLSPARRLLLVLALLLFLLQMQFTVGSARVGFGSVRLAFLILLVVFVLELKDKLLARDEIEVARQVQLSLLPRSHPEVPGWEVWGTSRPANDVGGDLVDYLHTTAGCLGIALGDVAGKGMGAALLSAKLQATLRALAPECATLDELGSRLNAALCRDGLDNRYATLFYCEIDPGSGRVRFLNAGHNPALLLRPDRAVALGASSLPLGMLPSAAYAGESIEMGAGDLLLLYSDGLTEARNARGEEFGVERLRQAAWEGARLPAAETAARLLAEVDRFLGEERLHDDLSLVIVRRRA